MTVVLKTDDNVLIWFDAVTSFSEDRGGSVTAHPVQSGMTVSDHFVKTNPRYSLSAIISNYDFNFGRTVSAEAVGLEVFNNQEVTTPVKIASDKPNPLLRLIPESVGAFINVTALPNPELDPTSRKNAAEEVRQLLTSLFTGGRFVSLLQVNGSTVINRTAQTLLITSLSFPESPDTGDALEVSMTFEEVRVVSLRAAAVPAVASRALEKSLQSSDGKGGNAGAGASTTTSENVGPESVRARQSILKDITDPLRQKTSDYFTNVSDFFRG